MNCIPRANDLSSGFTVLNKRIKWQKITKLVLFSRYISPLVQYLKNLHLIGANQIFYVHLAKSHIQLLGLTPLTAV